MKLVRPMTEEKLNELEKELNFQKQRFREAASRSADKIQKGLSVASWVRESPLRAAAFLFLGGFLMAQRLSGEKSPESRPETLDHKSN